MSQSLIKFSSYDQDFTYYDQTFSLTHDIPNPNINYYSLHINTHQYTSIHIIFISYSQSTNCATRSLCMFLGFGLTAVGVILTAAIIWWLQILVSWTHSQTFDDLPFDVHQKLMNTESRSPGARTSKKHRQSKHRQSEGEEDAALERFFGVPSETPNGVLDTGNIVMIK